MAPLKANQRTDDTGFLLDKENDKLELGGKGFESRTQAAALNRCQISL